MKLMSERTIDERIISIADNFREYKQIPYISFDLVYNECKEFWKFISCICTIDGDAPEKNILEISDAYLEGREDYTFKLVPGYDNSLIILLCAIHNGIYNHMDTNITCSQEYVEKIRAYADKLWNIVPKFYITKYIMENYNRSINFYPQLGAKDVSSFFIHFNDPMLTALQLEFDEDNCTVSRSK